VKTGDTIKVRPVGAVYWIECKVELASSNGKSLALSADEGLPTLGGFAIDPKTHRMVLMLYADGGEFVSMVDGGRFEVRESLGTSVTA